MNTIQRIPYGVSNFEVLRKKNYFFLDKTKYIERIENYSSPYAFFLRPRKFGKSLLISMLEYYYDINRKDKFDELFKDTYIGKNPTHEHNSYMILLLDFSGIKTYSDIKKTEEEFRQYFEDRFNLFLKHYNLQNHINKSEYIDKSPNIILEKIEYLITDLDIKIYLLIDEYDNFLNEILVNYGENTYMKITHGTGFIRSFFKKIKTMTHTNVIDRVFITGVTPMAMNDLTSGFNIGDNISLEPEFSELIGVTETELDEVIATYINKENDKQAVKNELKLWYNGYTFNPDNIDRKIYNTTSLWYYMKSIYHNSQPPTDLIDPNIKTDFGKLRFLISVDNKLNGNFSVLEQVLDKRQTVGSLVKNFSIGEKIDKIQFRSLLFYLGLLTIKGLKGHRLIFSIPNLSIENLLWEYLRKAMTYTYESLHLDVDFLEDGFYDMGTIGKWREVFTYILDKFYEVVSVRDFIFREEGVKMFFLAYLNLSSSYIVFSESEQSQGFADIYLEPVIKEAKYRFFVEFKYIKTDELDKKAEIIEQTKTRAIKQLKKYSKRFPKDTTKCVVIIAGSQEIVFLDEIQ